MTLYKEISGLSLQELVDRWRQHRPEEPGVDDGYLDDVAVELRRRGPDGVALLASQLDSPEEIRVTAAIIGLTTPPFDDLALSTTLLGLLSDRRPMVVAWAIRGLDRLGSDNALPQIERLITHKAPHVRCAALEFVRRHDPEHAEPVLLSALKDRDFLVRMCAADELGELDDPRVVPHLRPLLADPHPHVRQAARTAIDNLPTRAGAAD